MKRIQKLTIIFTLIGMIGALLITGVFVVSRKSLIRKKFKDPNGYFHFKYPSNWNEGVKVPGVAILLSAPREGKLDPYQESVNIVIQNISARPESLTEYSANAVREIKETFGPNMRIISSAGIKFAGQQGHRLVYMGKTHVGQELKIAHYWTIKGTTAYQFTFSAWNEESYERYQDVIDKMIRSFRILK